MYCGRRAARWLRRWVDKTGIKEGALFRRVGKGGEVRAERLGERSLQDLVKRWAAQAGVRGRITWHSLRIGAAQSLAAAGASLVEMQTAGRWKSPAMPAYYVRGQRAECGPVARLRDGTARHGAKRLWRWMREVEKSRRKCLRAGKEGWYGSVNAD